LYKELVRENLGHVRAFLCEADFWDVGTPADYLDACLSIGGAEGTVVQLGRRSHVDGSARVSESVIWDDVSVGAGATLERCIVADGVKIPAGASFRNCAMIQRDGELVVADL
jgi:NDP-sugar pyrophosphorylase family protein